MSGGVPCALAAPVVWDPGDIKAAFWLPQHSGGCGSHLHLCWADSSLDLVIWEVFSNINDVMGSSACMFEAEISMD